MVTALYKRAAT